MPSLIPTPIHPLAFRSPPTPPSWHQARRPALGTRSRPTTRATSGRAPGPILSCTMSTPAAAGSWLPMPLRRQPGACVSLLSCMHGSEARCGRGDGVVVDALKLKLQPLLLLLLLLLIGCDATSICLAPCHRCCPIAHPASAECKPAIRQRVPGGTDSCYCFHRA
jgi:hypothetical protein